MNPETHISTVDSRVQSLWPAGPGRQVSPERRRDEHWEDPGRSVEVNQQDSEVNVFQNFDNNQL